MLPIARSRSYSVTLLLTSALQLIFTASLSAAPPLADCLGMRDNAWSASEQFAWATLCTGEVVNLENKAEKDRKLSFKFLRTILTNSLYTALIPGRSVVISGAIFETSDTDPDKTIANATVDRLVLYHMQSPDLHLENPIIRVLLFSADRDPIRGQRTAEITITSGKIDTLYLSGDLEDVRLVRAEIMAPIYLSGSVRGLTLSDAHIHSDLIINDAAVLDGVYLTRALIDGDFRLEDRGFVGQIFIHDSKIRGILYLRESKIGELEIIGSEVNSVVLPTQFPEQNTRITSIQFSKWWTDLEPTLHYLRYIRELQIFQSIAASFEYQGKGLCMSVR
jgi:hypothetical protein